MTTPSKPTTPPAKPPSANKDQSLIKHLFDYKPDPVAVQAALGQRSSNVSQ